MAVRRLTKEEMVEINEIIRKGYGTGCMIGSGSKEQVNGKAIYHVVIGDPVNRLDDSLLKRIGKTLKDEYDSTAEYYYFGEFIA